MDAEQYKHLKRSFQTPSARGGIPLNVMGEQEPEEPESFKPLQRGAGFLCVPNGWYDTNKSEVSNPFSAGRDSSVQADAFFAAEAAGFKPLQRGAGFLCTKPTAKGDRADPCFKPLHRG